MTNELIAANSHGVGDASFRYACVIQGPTMFWWWIISSLIFLVLIVSCFRTGLKQRRNLEIIAMYSSFCAKLGLMSLVVTLFITLRSLWSDFFTLTGVSLNKDSVAMLAWDLADSVSAMSWCLLPGLLGITASMILDHMRLKQMSKNTKG